MKFLMLVLFITILAQMISTSLIARSWHSFATDVCKIEQSRKRFLEEEYIRQRIQDEHKRHGD